MDDMSCLLDFKNYIDNNLRKNSKEKYGKKVYIKYLYPFLEDTLEGLEEQIELAALETMHDDDLQFNIEYEGE